MSVLTIGVASCKGERWEEEEEEEFIISGNWRGKAGGLRIYSVSERN
jgi:hypothetical protein